MDYPKEFHRFTMNMISPDDLDLHTLKDSLHAAALMMHQNERDTAASFLEGLLASSITAQELEAFWWRFERFVPHSPDVARAFTQECIDILRNPVSPPGWNDA